MTRPPVTMIPSDQRWRIDRRPFDGPILADLAEASSPYVAQSDARWAAAVLAGHVQDAAELRDWLLMTGLLPAPPRWSTEGVTP
jgi:hypothetical protein